MNSTTEGADPSFSTSAHSDKPSSQRRPLRNGWTTGTCASAAAKAAAEYLITQVLPKEVEIALPSGLRVSFPVGVDEAGLPYVEKDAGDDPDCTHGAHLTASAKLLEGCGEVILKAGVGIGTVTKAGLGLELGAPAINPVPRRMIEHAVGEVTERSLEITFSVPGGEKMALKTTNERLGIVGGISILGTTGIVRPFSTAAFRASVVQQIDVAAAQGETELVLATGSRSEKAARELFPSLDIVCFVEVGDFSGVALKRAAGKGFTMVHWVGMVGKISKLAQGTMMTHFHRSHLDTEILKWAATAANSSEATVQASTATSTARHFFEVCVESNELAPLYLLCQRAKENCLQHISDVFSVEVVMVDFDGTREITRSRPDIEVS